MSQDIINGVHRATQRARIPAIVGRAVSGGGWDYDVDGWPEKVWVTLRGPSTGNSPMHAKNLLGVSSPTDDGKPVWCELQPDNMLAITARRTEEA